MTEFRYVQITLIIILGLGVTEILRNIANQIRSRTDIEVYPLQIAVSWSILLFILMWLWSFSQSIDVKWTLPVFLLQMLPPIALALSAQIVGLDFNSTKSSKQQYFDNCTAIYLILAIVPMVTVFTTMANSDYMPTTRDYLTLINISRLVQSGFIASLGFIKKPLYHWSVVIGLLIIALGSELIFVFKLNF
jgi:hypothetical protein